MVEVDVSPLSIHSHHLFLYLALNPPSSSNQEDNLALIYINRYNAHYYFLPTNQDVFLIEMLVFYVSASTFTFYGS